MQFLDDVQTKGLGLVSIVLMILAFIYRKKMQRFQKYGYLGVFLISAVGNVVVMSPAAPMVTFAAGAIYNFWLVGIVAGLGAITGAILSYNIGKAAAGESNEASWNTTISEYMNQYGFLIILLLACVPNPFFDSAGMVAGVSKYGFWKLLVPSSIGKCLKYTLFAYVGRIVNKRNKEK